MSQPDEAYMQLALAAAEESAERGEVPVGACLVDGEGNIVARSGNSSITNNDPTAHAEMLVLREAGSRCANYRLPDCTLYVTLEPCVMCMGAMVHARLKRLVYGAVDPKTGAAESLYAIGSDKRLNHQLEISGGVLAGASSRLLKAFFRARR